MFGSCLLLNIHKSNSNVQKFSHKYIWSRLVQTVHQAWHEQSSTARQTAYFEFMYVRSSAM